MQKITYVFGKKLRAFREKAGLSQTELAKKIGNTQRAISKFENGETLPTYGSMFRLGKALKIHPGEFF
jgi:transcriptional regulator with XRE-family HTH domain